MTKQYDIAIIGASLTARITATLLAKHGSKVLLLCNRDVKAPTWFHSSLFLEKLLGVLGGRSCFVDQEPIQVISARSRVTLSSDVPLEAELTREFGTAGIAVHQWLDALAQQGTKLEEFFWDNGGLPWPTLKAAAQAKLLAMKRRVNLAELDQPVARQLTAFDGPARAFLTDLLQGLALTSVESLPHARAAMLWAQVQRPESLREPDFSNLLTKRFEQFHGAAAPFDELTTLDFDGTRWTGGQFKSGGAFTAKTFLLGDRRVADLFGTHRQITIPAAQSSFAYNTSDLTGQLSPLLRHRLICGGPHPLRLAITAQDEQLIGLILTAVNADEATLHKQLEPVLPFAKYRFAGSEEPETGPALGAPEKPRPLAHLPFRISGNLYWADRTALLPELGAAGAAMLAWTLLDNLHPKTNPAKE